MSRGVALVVVMVVAILTRSGDRVQRCDTFWCSSQLVMLRSSPGPETGCSGR